MTELITGLVVLIALAACGPALGRWLRVAQREHYYRGSVRRFTARWWTSTPRDLALGALAIAGAAGSLFFSPAALATAAAVTIGPVGLSIRGRTSPLVWTARMRLLGGACLAIDLVAAALALVVSWLLQAPGVLPAGVAALAIAQPLVVEAALLLTAPIERRRSAGFVAQASARLGRVAPTIVAITGSYGKTTTKQYVHHLLASTRRVLASPASFNNTGGLARTVNEQLVPGIEVFVAEMGTYGPGEIADLCRWIQPDIAVITAIGPVHLERMGSLDTVVAAKAEILARARIAVLNIDAHGLAAQADAFAARGDRVIRCSTADRAADVWAGLAGADRAEGAELVVCAAGRSLARFPAGSAQPGNVACAVGVALALDVPDEVIAAQLATLPVPAHRQQQATNAKGVTVIDDTYNANPAGAAAALRLLARQTAAGRRVVVTPGMIELGPLQDQENAAFARAAATSVASDVIVVGRTNRTSLMAGARGGAAQVRSVDHREQAVAWVRETLGAGDAVLYENDLPDHYP